MSKYRLVSLALCAILILIMSVPCLAQGSEARDLLSTEKCSLVIVSKYGDTSRYPENSAQGVAAAFEKGADMVAVNVSRTADGEFVLFGDDSLKRMCVDADGNPVDRLISEVTLEELGSYRLRVGKGGTNADVTAYTVSTLEDTLKELDGEGVLIIDGVWEYREEIAELLDMYGAEFNAFLVADGSKKETLEWLNKDRAPFVLAKYKGNVIWNCLPYINKTASAGAMGIILASSNPYSVSFSSSVVGKTQGKMRAVIDMTDPKLCGKRDDTAVYWDDVTSRGFSVIMTDDIEGLGIYTQRVEQSRERLSLLIQKADSLDYTAMSAFNANKLKSAVLRAQKAQTQSVSAMALDNCYTELSDLLDGLSDSNAKTHGKLTVSTGRVAAAIAAIAAFVFFELLIARVRNKRIVLRRKGIDKKGRYKLKDKQ